MVVMECRLIRNYRSIILKISFRASPKATPSAIIETFSMRFMSFLTRHNLANPDSGVGLSLINRPSFTRNPFILKISNVNTN